MAALEMSNQGSDRLLLAICCGMPDVDVENAPIAKRLGNGRHRQLSG
jgi:hypothetical protein